ncbi:MAG: PhzF family phenazine biosynthesis protein [Deltaproteobacteria bacterium]|nr:PhzF family phenazine biosynthesis protein [Deltaproteobacteria bacterium]
MNIPLYQVDAFTKEIFKGNPAAVCVLESWPDDEILQGIAAENNLSETAFLVNTAKGHYDLRWFTPTIEVDLCGHATLASAFVICSFFDTGLTSVDFKTASGLLTVAKSGELLSMDFPARKPIPVEAPSVLMEAFGMKKPVEVQKSRDLLVVFDDEGAVKEMNPDFELLGRIKDVLGIIVTAPGKNADFVSRFFAPNAGILEDPVTGSSHCTLIPYWAERLGKNKLHAYQVSKRGGELFCEDLDDRVRISGHAVLYAKGEIYI